MQMPVLDKAFRDLTHLHPKNHGSDDRVNPKL